jgi:GDP-mannose 6-dehydrogenase
MLPGLLENRLAPILEEAAQRRLGDGLALCNNPEFLRETTAIADYDAPPFVIVGAAAAEDAAAVFDLYERVPGERIITDTRTAALVKYACNTFHALKVAFANEIGAVAKDFGADGQDVMRILCQDHRLNISPAYLRPGFAFGGSCLPKDVRALCRAAQQRALRTDLLNAVLPSNDSQLQRALALIQNRGLRRIGLVGLSFKAGTDDLRESPQVSLAEVLLGKGYDLRIYDPGVKVSRLVGTNLAYVDRHLPHLAALLIDEAEELLQHAELLVLATNVANDIDCSRFSGEVLDLRRDLAVERFSELAST